MTFRMPDMTAAELRETQLGRLPETLVRAYDNVPHYRKAFDTAGVHPGDISTLEDLSRLPFTTKADLREEIRSLEIRLLKWAAPMLIGQVAVFAAVIEWILRR